MNKERREKISNIAKELQYVIDNLSNILSDEEYAFENMPENLQGSIRGEESEEAIDIISEAIDSLQSARDNLEEI